jgi:DNA-binding transcriptional LysR family regulator
MDKLRAMTAFARIVEKGSLTAAAADMGTSLPSVVRMLAALERELGATLLHRTTRRIRLTDEGRQYHEHCRIILGQLREAEATLASRRLEPHGKLTVTASVTFGRRYVAPIMNEFARRYPKLSVDLLFVDRVVNLIEEGVDVALRIGPLQDSSSLVAIPVGRVRRVVCASPRYLRAHGVPRRPDDVRAHRCVRFTGLAPRSEWQFRVDSRLVSIPIASPMTCNQVDAALEACIGGLGLGSFLSYMTAPAKRARKLAYVLEKFETDPLAVHVVYPYSRILSANVRAFVDACVQKLRQTDLQ